ncbi:MAG: serine hydrolase domain-containing protein, partial [Rubripirellula sp.]
STAGDWETVEPDAVHWDKAKLAAALQWAGEVGSSGVVVLLDGKILAESHWTQAGDGDLDGKRPDYSILGTNDSGHSIEDVASVQKSITSILVGIAQQKGLLSIDDAVSKHLGQGWSKAEVSQESQITIRHLLSMTSGLSDRLEFTARPGTKWRYNTPAYSRARDCVVAAAKMELNDVTREWLTGPLGMKDSKWTPRPAFLRSINGYGFASTARDLARFGLMMQAGGRWNGKEIVSDKEYLKQVSSSSQKLNLAYGFLWWLNRGKRVTSAPGDTYSANGAKTRRLYVMPSYGLVVTRIGASPKMEKPRDFDKEFCRRVLAARQDD